MTKYFVSAGDDLKAIAQSLLEGKRAARSIENLVASLYPLCTDQDTADHLKAVGQISVTIGDRLQAMYDLIAADAFRG